MLFDDFFMTTWEQENKSERKKEPPIPRLGVPWSKLQFWFPANLGLVSFLECLMILVHSILGDPEEEPTIYEPVWSFGTAFC